MEKDRVFANATTSMIQVSVNVVVLFFLYRFLLGTIGVAKVGIWSVVLATASFGSVGHLGFSGSVVKFVAKYLALQQDEAVSRIIQTATLSIAVFMGIFLVVVYPFAAWILGLVMPKGAFAEACSLLPYALLTLWLNVVGMVVHAGLEGHQRIKEKNVLLMAGALFLLFVSFLLVPSHGLTGLAYAYVAQSGLLVVGGWFLLKSRFSLLPWFPHRWEYSSFREMLTYGASVQVISISQLVLEPVTKALLTKFGDLAMTGFYDMASRMIMNLRWLLVSAIHVLVPAVADLQEKKPEVIRSIYKESYGVMSFIAIPFFSLIVVFSPFISVIWIGGYEEAFVTFSGLLALGWLFNILSTPAYVFNLGVGTLRWNVIGYGVTALLNLALSLLLGRLWGGYGVVVGYLISLITGSLIIFLSYHAENRIPVGELFSKKDLAVVVASTLALLLFFVERSPLLFETDSLSVAGVTVLVFLALTIRPIWVHPLRKRLTGWIVYEVLKAG